jgi:type I restriction enzyme S subunit
MNEERGEWTSTTLPAGWNWVPFKSVFDDVTDSARKLPQKDYAKDGAFPVVDQGEGFVGGYTDNDALVHPMEPPFVVFGDHTRCVKYVDFPFVQGADGIKALRPKQGVDARYSYYALRALTLPDKGYSRHMKFLRASLFPICSLTEQRRIVANLDSLFSCSKSALGEISSIPRLVTRYRQAILKRALSGDLTQGWRSQNPAGTTASDDVRAAHGTAVKVRRSKLPTRRLFELDELPSSWCFARLEDICSNIVDGTHHTPVYTQSGVPFISVKDIRGGKVLFDDCKFISAAQHHELSRRCGPRIGDLLITKSGTIGRCAIVDTNREFSLFVSVALVRPATTRILSSYIKMAIEYWISLIDISSDIVGSTIKNLHLQDIKILEIPLPPYEEQLVIVESVEKLSRVIDNIESDSARAGSLIERLDKAVLAKAFRGELNHERPHA